MPNVGTVQESVNWTTGTAKSDAIFIGDWNAITIQIPATMTAVVLTFETSQDGSTFVPAYNATGAAAETIATIAVSRSFLLPASVCAANYIKLVAPGNEGGTRTILVTKKNT